MCPPLPSYVPFLAAGSYTAASKWTFTKLRRTMKPMQLPVMNDLCSAVRYHRSAAREILAPNTRFGQTLDTVHVGKTHSSAVCHCVTDIVVSVA